MRHLRNKVLSLIVIMAYLGLGVSINAQGTLTETATTMELQQQMQIRAGETPAPAETPVAEANNAMQEDTLARYEKVAQKLLKSLQTGSFNREDFSATWNAVVPADTDFSAGINALIRPMLAQFGRAEKLLEGKIAGPGRAIFPVQFSGGTLDMAFTLDSQDKIGEWLLTPKGGQMPATGEQPATQAETTIPVETNEPNISDFNSFQKELNRINIETRSEEQEWLEMSEEKKIELARTIEELVTAQLRFIRKLAETEDANQTVKAIDLVLRQRRERLANLETKLSEEIREERQPQMGEPGTTPRMPRRERQERTTRERPARRTREAEGQQ